MISPPVCTNKKCSDYMVFKKGSIIKTTNSKNKYVCEKCKKEFEWSMLKKKYGITY